jgi:hypothetical protein
MPSNNLTRLVKSKQKTFIDETGKVFGQWTVVSYIGGARGRWLCLCVCGTQKSLRGDALRNGSTRSCGCSNRSNHRTHGATDTPEHDTYCAARMRCMNPSAGNYHRYGGSGIEFRFQSFEDFLDEVGCKPTPKHTLDRIDPTGHYERGNVRWATMKEQANNRQNSVKLKIRGIEMSLVDWSKQSPVHITSIHRRLQHGFCHECAVFLPRGDKCLH